MKMYKVKITAYANYPIEDEINVKASGFRAGAGKAINQFMEHQAKINPRRKRKINSITLNIQI